MYFNKKEFKAALDRKGISVKVLAGIIGIDEATLYRKISGKSEFTRREIAAICDALDLESPMNIFFTDELA